MSALSDAIKAADTSADAAIARVQTEVASLRKQRDDLQAKVDAGGDPADVAAIAALQAKLDALDPTKPDVLPPAPGPTPEPGPAPEPAPAPAPTPDVVPPTP